MKTKTRPKPKTARQGSQRPVERARKPKQGQSSGKLTLEQKLAKMEALYAHSLEKIRAVQDWLMCAKAENDKLSEWISSGQLGNLRLLAENTRLAALVQQYKDRKTDRAGPIIRAGTSLVALSESASSA